MTVKTVVMECWSIGVLSRHSTTPFLHRSIPRPPQLHFVKTLLIHCA